MQLPDAEQRDKALDPGRSCIVQAPAGSGKTELLVQRYLALLSRVRQPEEILAITFTRKAASEMRTRIIQAIARAREEEPPDREPERTAWGLAREVAVQDRRRAWSLVKSPSRLRIQTIDALAASLTRQMPVLSGFGAQPDIVEDPEALYHRAAERTVQELESRGSWSASLEVLFGHLDNDLEKVAGLIADMLGRRDQWLRHLAGSRDGRLQRVVLERGLQRLIADRLADLRARLPEEAVPELLALARYAASNLEPGSSSALAACARLKELPGTDPDQVPVWLGLAELLLTRSGAFRKRADRSIGFPAPGSAASAEEKSRCKAMKEAHAELIASLGRDAGLRESLHRLRRLPAATYAEGQWRLLRALFEILPLAVAHLHLLFRSRSAVDFTEISLRALQALGAPQDPTDLALILDYRLQHILVDEFQDTSLTQFALLERLTEGWQPGDGRTFFAVGDPMQSIYRFREAEVGLFLRAWERGIGQVRLEPVRLQTNFRSREGLVEEVNAMGSQVFPSVQDETAGAVAFSPSVALRPASGQEAVRLHPFPERDDAAEAAKVVEIVREERAASPESRIAVLVRCRSHLTWILPALRAAGLPFQALDIEPLGRRPVIRDLVTLCKALSHRADRLSWLAVLRAPWCGLTLADLHAVTELEEGGDLPSRLTHEGLLGRISPDGAARLRRVGPVLERGLLQRQRQPLSRLVEGVWLALGGPACLESAKDLRDARTFFALLDGWAGRTGISSFADFEREVDRLFAAPEAEADDSLQVLTIHKAKGLEFDTVILPGLGRQPQAERKPLLLWQERAARDGSRDLLLAPIAEAGRQEEAIYSYIRGLNSEKRRHESTRLAYVAMTRARERLHLLGHTALDHETGEPKAPASESLLWHLWPALEPAFRSRAAAGETPGARAGSAQAAQNPWPALRRLAAGWIPPDPPQGLPRGSGGGRISESEADPEPLSFDWAGEGVRQVGTVVHSYLQGICRTGLQAWDESRLERETPEIELALVRLGMEPATASQAAGEVKQALRSTLADPRGRWILAEHRCARSEYAVSGRLKGRLVNVVMDRTFVDEEGVRWIIDYKAGVHAGGDPGGFLDREAERYQPQLETYAALMRRLEARPIRLGLYFPRVRGWRSWSWTG